MGLDVTSLAVTADCDDFGCCYDVGCAARTDRVSWGGDLCSAFGFEWWTGVLVYIFTAMWWRCVQREVSC